MHKHHSGLQSAGFTLVELSIVLVIIGLIVGGILTGRDLIDAASVRAQIAQIQKYSTAVRTFQNKYNYLPGDIPEPYATQFGFQARGTAAGQGDGNGRIEGNCAATIDGWEDGAGENAVFWEDISGGFLGAGDGVHLIDTTITGYDVNGVKYPYTQGFSTGPTLTTTPAIKDWLPAAKLGNGIYIYTFSLTETNANYFSASTVTKVGCSVETTNDPGFTVLQAYNIDSKVDDGMPQTGMVMACYINKNIGSSPRWAAGGQNEGQGSRHCVSTTAATAYASYTCFDNGGVTGTEKYSLSNGSLPNCGMAFQFQ